MVLMTRAERNQVFRMIAASDIDVADCDTYATADSTFFTHKSGSEFIFKIGGFNDGEPLYTLNGHVFDGRDPRMPDQLIAVDAAAPSIHAWATEVRRVSEIPDYWAEMRSGQKLITEIQSIDSDNTSFTKDEQRRISAQLREIKEQIREQFKLTSEQFERIDARFDEAEEASTRMGRKDWLLLFGGTILNLIVTDTITPGLAGFIFTTVIQGIAHLFGGPPPQILT